MARQMIRLHNEKELSDDELVELMGRDILSVVLLHQMREQKMEGFLGM